VECGYAHTLALTSNGQVYSWGFGSQGCLGLGPDVNVSEKPSLVDFKMDEQDKNELIVSASNLVFIEQITSGSNHCMALSSQKRVYSWGSG